VLSGDSNAGYVESAEPPELGSELPLDPLQLLDSGRSRRFDRGAAFVTAGAEHALKDAGLAAEGVGLVAGTAFGGLERSVEFLRRVSERGPRFASPAEFPHLVPSAPAGNASIYLRLMGPVVSVADLATSGEAAASVAAGFVELGLANAMLAGSAEPYDAIVARVLDPLHGARGPEPRSEGGAWVLFESEQAARARGKRAMAAVISRTQRWGDPGRSFAEIGGPGVPPGRALVVMAVSDKALDAALAASAWAPVARRRVGKCAGTHEALGAFALAAGAALVARGDADEVLCLGGGHGRSYLVRLGRASPAAER
jgi:3-oxoacyl-[acyl-carrier-protein] synthase II